ncbi:MAG: aminotransferase [Anaerolineaceae bacterium]|nr:pyridoxal phosphate-dependent aminotransferase [Anaerolineae bacterium]MDL1925429.1 pyridoxal phosphate-dependent aminotransferase [Anaerolineae bacterium AMX1]WKZ53500.1 MAG: pyridoxal phosphate-dependent aminotransferase [Anaerolineales bacterium]GIK09968.1 MAG: aminotransferase [Chloroflexota bacterium]GJQ38929.1 MAG: aminotransferase [Anaerolineaceae bacterium]
MFANRIAHLEAEGAYAVLARASDIERAGREVLHLELGQPDFRTPETIAQAGVVAIEEGLTRYTSPAGLTRFRELIAADAGARRGVTVHPDMVVAGPGSKPGLFFPTLALVAPGDEVIYPDPGFPTYRAMIGVAGGTPVPVTLREENQFSFDLDVFDSKISDKTKLIILNSPANPTGGVIPLEDLKHIAKQAQKHDAWILADEIYSRLVYDGMESAPSVASIDGMLERTVIADGFSKAYAMTGWRLGYMIAPPALAERLELLITHSVGCTAMFTQYAGMEALTGPQDFVREMVIEYQKRRDRMVELANAIPGVHAQKPQGAFYVFPNVKSFGISSKEIQARLLEEEGVAVLAGTDFGPAGDGYIRLCYATSMEVIERAMEKIHRFFERL